MTVFVAGTEYFLQALHTKDRVTDKWPRWNGIQVILQVMVGKYMVIALVGRAAWQRLEPAGES